MKNVTLGHIKKYISHRECCGTDTPVSCTYIYHTYCLILNLSWSLLRKTSHKMQFIITHHMLFIWMHEPISKQRYHSLNSFYSTCTISIFCYWFYVHIRIAAAVPVTLGKLEHREPSLLIASKDHKQKGKSWLQVKAKATWQLQVKKY